MVPAAAAGASPQLNFFFAALCQGFAVRELRVGLWLLLSEPCDLLLQVGQARSFNFFGWPDKSRIRLSQILVPPAHQAKGAGRALLEAVYRTAIERDALDVTVRAAGDTCGLWSLWLRV